MLLPTLYDMVSDADIVKRLRMTEILGATAYRGILGYGAKGYQARGETSGIHRRPLPGHESPIVVTVVDSAGSIAHLLAAVEAMMEKGMITSSEVEAIRIEKPA